MLTCRRISLSVPRELGLEPKSNPAMRIVCSGVISRRDCIDKRKEARVSSAGLVQLPKQLSPLGCQHGFQPLPGDIA